MQIANNLSLEKLTGLKFKVLRYVSVQVSNPVIVALEEDTIFRFISLEWVESFIIVALIVFP